MAKEEKGEQGKNFIFGSKHPGYMLVLDPGGPRFDEERNMYIPKMPFRGVTFNEGVFDTSDAKLAAEMRKHSSYGSDFWEIKTPEDAARVNMGRRLAVSGSAKSTSSVAGRKS